MFHQLNCPAVRQEITTAGATDKDAACASPRMDRQGTDGCKRGQKYGSDPKWHLPQTVFRLVHVRDTSVVIERVYPSFGWPRRGRDVWPRIHGNADRAEHETRRK